MAQERQGRGREVQGIAAVATGLAYSAIRFLRRPQAVILDNQEPTLYAIWVRYTRHGSGRHLVLLKNNISYALMADGNVSLPTGSNEYPFPAYSAEAGEQTFALQVVGSASTSYTIDWCVAEKIDSRHPEITVFK